MKNKGIFLFIALFAIMAVLAFAQSSGTDLVLPDGEAWIVKNGNLGNGWIFKSDGTYMDINDYDGEVFGAWTIITSGTYTVRRNEIVLTPSDPNRSGRSFNFTVSGNTLTLVFWGEATNYTRTNGINPRQK